MELLVVGAILLVIFALGALSYFFTWDGRVGISIALIAFGLVVSVPTMAYYYLLFYRAYPRTDADTKLPRGWFWNPFKHMQVLGETRARRSINRWAGVSAAGAVVIVLGLLVLVVTMIQSALAR